MCIFINIYMYAFRSIGTYIHMEDPAAPFKSPAQVTCSGLQEDGYGDQQIRSTGQARVSH